ncbi:hypothetical protein SAMN04244571_00697 [Azotobacter beijerinckii]|uniref:Uncharacterized protein n=1 Tax=Azotobacter beijerinckii TaxID=170623 RepID=A0A1I0WLA0_9GAMM|nr:hypothetical protein SAMN04244571_00697 [Azotobacter beijerinckii]
MARQRSLERRRQPRKARPQPTAEARGAGGRPIPTAKLEMDGPKQPDNAQRRRSPAPNPAHTGRLKQPTQTGPPHPGPPPPRPTSRKPPRPTPQRRHPKPRRHKPSATQLPKKSSHITHTHHHLRHDAQPTLEGEEWTRQDGQIRTKQIQPTLPRHPQVTALRHKNDQHHGDEPLTHTLQRELRSPQLDRHHQPPHQPANPDQRPTRGRAADTRTSR